MKGPISKGLAMSNHTTFEEAKLSCLARKRKERQESVSSISQESKVIRSSSEERPLRNGEQSKDIRRVSSHESIKKQEKSSEDNCNNYNDDGEYLHFRDVNTFIYDDHEHEKRRSHERFARPLAPRGRRSNAGKKPKTRHFSKVRFKPETVKENGNNKYVSPSKPDTATMYNSAQSDVQDVSESKLCIESFLQLHQDEKQRSPSPEPVSATPTIDLSTLHEQIDCTEPIPSSTNKIISEDTETLPSAFVASSRLLLSPRNSIIMTHRIYLDPDIPQPNGAITKCKNPIDQRLKELTKQINGLKRKIKTNEDEFETKFGYKPSHSDKVNDKMIRKLYSELNQIRREFKQLKEDPSGNLFESGHEQERKSDKKNSSVSLKETLLEIEQQLYTRQCLKESTNYEELSLEQILEEKTAMQKALLYLESLHGRPSAKEERDLVRPLYDKYRTLKRLISKAGTNTGINELATIHENETMDFVSSPPAQLIETDSEKTPQTGTSTDSDTDTSIGENLHSMTREELLIQQTTILEQKKELRRSLKQFELDFQTKTGRKVQKEDKLPMENSYISYKKAKAKLRLLDALLNKQTP